MVRGLRVVRGPNWDHGNQDGGQDHVGTVVEEQGEHAVKVQWDTGSSTVCMAGNGKHELRIFDSATIGVSHPNIGCVSCEEICIIGTLWRCSVCDNTNLCTLCYHDDKHDTRHMFLRIDFPGSDSVPLPKRISSQKSRALGIYPNATVSRGVDWKDGDQECRPGDHGIVEDVVNFGHDASDRNAVRVRWKTGKTGVYRVGYQGNVDLTCEEEAPGGSFYPTHLADLDLAKHNKWNTLVDLLVVGDTVCVEITSERLKQLQQGRRNWSARMEEIIGELGVINRFTSEGDVEVDYGGDTITFVKAAVCKVPNHNKGDKVKVIGIRDKMKRLQKKHGGWDDSMEEVMGKIATVSVIDNDGDVGVTFDDGNGFVFHPACLIPVQKSNDDDEEEQSDSESSDAEDNSFNDASDVDTNEEESEGVNLIQALAGLLLLDALANQTNEQEGQIFLKAVSEGDVTAVKQMLVRNPDLKDFKHKGIPCLLVAAFQGHVTVIETLLDNGVSIDDIDERGSSALMIAISADNLAAAQCLIRRGADIRAVNKNGRTPCHAAAIKNMAVVLRILLEKGCDPNAQDELGDTPLHDAISERHDEAATVLIQHPTINVWLQNVKQCNVMHLACMKPHPCAVDKLLSRELKLASTAKADGFMPLHITALNNHINEASILLVKAGADVNATTRDKCTPLHLAAWEAYFDMVKLLLTYGADWNAKDINGNTPLHACMMGRRTDEMFLQLLGLRNFAEDNERIKIANFFIQHGANIDAVNNAGNTPIDGCKMQHMREAVMAFAANNKPTKPEKATARPRTANVERDIFTSSKQKCHKCAQYFADVRFMPCKHQVACDKCCFKFKMCPICGKEISKRVDKNNKAIESSCVIS